MVTNSSFFVSEQGTTIPEETFLSMNLPPQLGDSDEIKKLQKQAEAG
jgi:hypothetical protein